MNKKKIVILLISILMLLGCVVSSVYFHNKGNNKAKSGTDQTIETANIKTEQDGFSLSEGNVDFENPTEEHVHNSAALEDVNADNSVSGSSAHGGTTIQASSDNQESETTEIPNEPVIPVTTETPSAPTAPSTTEAPSVPTTPSTTEAPSVPTTPSTTEAPVEPTTAVAADDSTEGKTWVPPVYKEVWVVDQEACTIENPVYEVIYVNYCNQCGAELTNPTEHFKASIKAGTNCGSYTTKPVQVQVGVEIIEVPEQGHWEKVLVQEGYWI